MTTREPEAPQAPKRLQCLRPGCRVPPHFVGADGYCISHSVERRDQKIAAVRKGGDAHKPRALPLSAEVPRFTSRESVVAWAEETAHLVLTDQLDPRLASEARGLAGLALQAHELAALDRLTKLERVILRGKRLA